MREFYNKFSNLNYSIMDLILRLKRGNIRILLVFLFLCVLGMSVSAQQVTVKGIVKDPPDLKLLAPIYWKKGRQMEPLLM